METILSSLKTKITIDFSYLKWNLSKLILLIKKKYQRFILLVNKSSGIIIVIHFE